jgi:prepilin-type N-terminal cleavage/methylation domain-containing protein
LRRLRRRSPAADDSGFSLVELLVIIVIIGILTGIAVPTFLSQRQKGWAAAAQSDSRILSKMVLTAEADGLNLKTISDFAAFRAQGFNPSMHVLHRVCVLADSSFAVASKHASSDAILIVDLGGRLVESTALDMELALDAVVLPATCVNEIAD